MTLTFNDETISEMLNRISAQGPDAYPCKCRSCGGRYTDSQYRAHMDKSLCPPCSDAHAGFLHYYTLPPAPRGLVLSGDLAHQLDQLSELYAGTTARATLDVVKALVAETSLPTHWEKNGPQIASMDPIEVKYDGLSLRVLLERDRWRRQEDPESAWRSYPPLTPVQVAAVSAYQSAELRRKVAASKAADRNLVTYCEEDEP